MKTFTYQIQDPIGIHARPAGQLVKLASSFSSKIIITCGDKQTDITHLMSLMGMGITHGSTVTITVEGTDEQAATAAIQAFFQESL